MAQSPLDQMAERAADTHPGLGAAASAVGLEDHRRMLHQAAQRVKDSHRAQAKALGIDVGGDAETDEMGNIVITGDIRSNEPNKVIDSLLSQTQPGALPVAQPSPQPQSQIAKTIAAIGLATAGTIAAWNLTRPATPAVTPTIPSAIDMINDLTPGFGKPEYIGSSRDANQ